MKVSALDKPKCASQILDRANPQVLKLSKACFYGWGVRGRPPLTLVMHRKYCTAVLWSCTCVHHQDMAELGSVHSSSRSLEYQDLKFSCPKRVVSLADAG